MPYAHKTIPFKHQEEFFERTRDLTSHAVFWEQGTGKTKVTIDTVAWNYLLGKINGVLIIAPSGVHSNWILDELPAHLPKEVAMVSRTMIYRNKSSGTVYHRKELAQIVKAPGLAWLAMNYDAFITQAGRQAAWDFLRERKVFYVLDESSRVKTPSAKRTRTIVSSGKYAKFRRILDGTPLTNGPFDIYSPLEFLEETFWKKLQLGSFTMFKNYFGIFKQIELRKKQGDPVDAAPKTFPQLVSFQRLDELNKIIDPISSRVLKKDVLDLPDKIYQKRYFTMTTEQQRLYDDLKTKFVTWLNSGEVITANLAIVRLLRFQQITCGYLPVDILVDIESGDKSREWREIDAVNPRIELYKEVVEDTHGKIITWARFTRDIDKIMEALQSMGRKPVRYDGLVSEDQRLMNKEAFQHGDATDFVGKPSVGGTGITLTACDKTIYYNNSFKLMERLQSEDRNHRIGQKNNVVYTDLLAESSIDAHILRSLGKKLDISNTVLGDEVVKDLRTWFSA
jgi:SNF2 family DNA or RNA helicase